MSLIPFSAGPRRDLVTILLVTPTRLVRADFEGRPEPTLRQIWEARAPGGETLPVLAEAAFMLGVPRKAWVYVLYAGASTQLLQVPSGKVAGLEGDDLNNALSFEAESISGLNPFDSSLASVPAGSSGGDRSYWVTQVGQADLGQIQETLLQRRAYLRGVLHPGGLMRAMGHSTSGWQRVELWNDVVVAVDGSSPQSVRVNVIGSAPSRGMWRPQVEQWYGPTPSDRAVMVADSSLIQYAEGPSLSLDEESVLRQWLTEWAVELAGDRVRVPLVRPAPRPMPDSQRLALAVALALTAGGICVGHYFFLQARDRMLRGELEKAEAPTKLLAAFKAQANTLQTELESVRRESRELRDLREFWKDTLDKEHRRHATLLATLARATPADLAIVTINEHAGELHVTGLSMTPDVPGFATNVAAAVEPFGWRIEPPRRRALNLAPDGGPWKLDWSLRTTARFPGVDPASKTNAPAAGVGQVDEGASDVLRSAAEAAGAAAALVDGPQP